MWQLDCSFAKAYGVSCRARAEGVALHVVSVIRPGRPAATAWFPRSPTLPAGDSASRHSSNVLQRNAIWALARAFVQTR
jgi:hypothetical protein